MKNTKLKMLVRACSILTSVAILITSPASALAEDSVEDLENKTSDLQNELSDLNTELDNLSAELDSIMQKMKTTTDEMEQTKLDLANAQAEEKSQYEAMKVRIKYMYENGNTSFMEILFSSSSMAEFLNRADFITTIAEYDRALLDQLIKIQDTVAEKEKALQTEQKELVSLQEELEQKEADLTAKISSASGSLEAYTAKLAEAKERAKAAQEALEKKAEPTPEPEPEQKPESPKEENPSDSNGSSNNGSSNVDASELELFAALIECEAGSTDYDGMLAVASVVMNRVNHRFYPNTITGVIYQSGQFSPVASGKVDKVLKRGVKSSCVNVAQDAIAGKNNIGDCLNFRAASSGHSGIVIGGNVFF